MKHPILKLILLVNGAFGLAACTDSGSTNLNVNTNRLANSAGNAVNTVVNTTEKAADTVANAIDKTMTSSPTTFMEEAAQGGNAEVEMGRLAVQKAKDPEIKRFGQMMIDEHSKTNAELKKLAESKKFTLPSDMGGAKGNYDKLKGLAGDDFDKAYVDAMVDDHESDVTAFQRQADNGSDPAIKAFAAKTLPVLKKHLETIRNIKAKMK